MLYRKNVPGWERTMRVLAGVMMAAVGWYLFPFALRGYLMAAMGVFVAMTGFVGFCPICYVGGRRLPEAS